MFRDDEFREENTGNFEKQNVTGRNDEDPQANTPVKVLTASSVIGDKVENFNGDDLGHIKDVMLNMQTGCTEYVVLQYGGFLGMGEKYFAVPFRTLALNPANRSFVLNREKDYLKNAPGFDKDHWPETNSRHWDDVNEYWGPEKGTDYTGGPII